MSHSTDNEESFADLIGTVKKLDQQKINPYQEIAKDRGNKPRLTYDSTNSYSGYVEELSGSYTKFNEHKTPAPEEWFNAGIQKKLQKRIRQGSFPIDNHVDLHGFRLAAATRTLQSFIKSATFYQQKLVLVIHGKGLQSKQGPVIKPMVLDWLHHNPAVLAYCPAQIHHGGQGASYVYLR